MSAQDPKELPRLPHGGLDLRRWMFDRGMTISEIAAETGLTPKTIHNLHNGQWPAPKTAFQIAAVVGVPASVLWDPYGPSSDLEPAA